MLTFSGYKAFSFDLFSSPLLNKSGQALASAVGYMGDQWPPLEWLRCLLGKKQDRNYITFKPRPQNEVCHKKYNFVYFTLLFRTVFTAQPQEPGTLYHTTSGTSTVQFAISRKNFLITTCISVSLFMMSISRPRPIRVCVSIATLLGHWPACSIECVVDSFINVCPYSVCYFCFYCFHKYTVIIVSISFINILIFCYFLDLVIWLALWVLVSVPGLLPKFVNE